MSTAPSVARIACVAVALLVGACGGQSEAEKVAGVLADDLRSADVFADGITSGEAECVGDAIVEDLGVDEARSLGRGDGATTTGADGSFDLEGLGDEGVEAIGDAMETCVDDLESIVIDLVATGILEAPDEDFPVSESEATCVGTEVAGEIPFGRLLTIGLRAEGTADGAVTDLDQDEAEVFAGAFTSCVDVRSILLDQVAASGADDEVVACLDSEISDGAIEQLFVATFAGDESAAAGAFQDAIDACA